MKKIMIYILCIFLLCGCSDSSKIASLEKDIKTFERALDEHREANNELKNELAAQVKDIQSIQRSLGKSYEKVAAYESNLDVTQRLISKVQKGAHEEAKVLADTVDSNYFTDVNSLLMEMGRVLTVLDKSYGDKRVDSNSKVKKGFHSFIASFVIFVLYALIVIVLVLSLICVVFLIATGNGATDILVRACGVIAFLILYFMSSFYGLSLSALMLNSAVVAAPIFEWLTQWAVPFIAGGFFAVTIKHQILKEHFYAERWLIVVTTLLFCMLLDLFLNVEADIIGHQIPVSNATFIVGLFITLFFNLQPESYKRINLNK